MQPYYDDGAGIQIYLGDCREVLPTLGAVDLVLTDPPYNVGYAGRWGSKAEIQNDATLDWLEPSFREVARVLVPSGLCLSFYGWPHADIFVSTWKRIGFRLLSHLVWVKNVWGLGYYTRGQHEQAYLLGLAGTRKPTAPISDVLEWTRVAEPQHPTQKPLDALYPCITAYSPPDGVVLDPFMGSGSTLRAAKDCGRRAIGIEISEEHCQTAANRLRQMVLPLDVTA